MNGLKIVKASAGSGKTFRLTAEYLKLLFEQEGKFHNILAVTFTNKATQEMQERILEELSLLWHNKESDHLDFLKKATQLDEARLREKAGVYLQQILHNYSYFKVSTIDSFFQQILKGFSREIGLSNGFNIELDSNKIIKKAVEQMLSEMSENKELQKWLQDFAFEQIQDEKNWDIEKKLVNFAKNALQENFLSFDEDYLSSLTLEKFSVLNQELDRIIKDFVTFVRKTGDDFCKQIEKYSLEVTDFYYGYKGVVGYFSKLKNVRASSFELPTIRVKSAINSKDQVEGWTKSNSPKKHEVKDCVSDGLQKIACDFGQFCENKFEEFLTALITKKHLNTFAVFIEIYKYVLNYCRENDLFLLSLSSPLLSKMIANNDTPFIYEKTGHFIEHFMIDEFQDTSIMQWKNFSPLVSDSLAQNKNTLIVGDIKQAIYRWRNGNWELLSRGIKEQFEAFQPKEENLPYNWRSKKNIVLFNNWFFKKSSEIIEQENRLYLENETYNSALNIAEIYKDCEQQIPTKNEDETGYIKLLFTNYKRGDENIKEKQLEHLQKGIKELTAKGYQPKDMAILVRKKAEGVALAKYLMQLSKLEPENAHLYRFVSSESVFLSSSDAVWLIVLLMNWVYKQENIFLKAQIIQLYFSLNEDYEKATELLSSIDLKDNAVFLDLFPKEFKTKLTDLKQSNLSNMMSELIRIFFAENTYLQHQMEKNIAFIHLLQDEVLNYSNNFENNIEGFMEWWKNEGKETSIKLSEEQNAIRIMTIHKSKGLEFKAVFIPFVNWNFTNSKNLPLLWEYIDKPPFSIFKSLPIDYNEKLKNSFAKKAHTEEYLRLLIDNLNLLYVAFTRAKNCLYIFSNKMNSSNKESKISSITSVLNLTMNNEQAAFECLEDEGNQIFEWGEIPEIEQEEQAKPTAKIKNYKLGNYTKKLRIKTEGKAIFQTNEENVNIQQIKGRIYHKIFEFINTEKDIENAVSKVTEMGLIDKKDKNKVMNQIQDFINKKDVNDWFSEKWNSKNERSILLKNGEIKRPDRVIENEEKIIVIDYKFAETEKKQYEKQVLAYTKAIESISKKNVEGYIWYVNLNKVQKIH